MKRTTVMLPERLRAQAKEQARRLGVSFGELIRRSLEAMLGGAKADDPLLADDEVFDGPTPDDLAADPDRYLYGPER
jgi:hypothetical protein